jgi:hypothetical protein
MGNAHERREDLDESGLFEPHTTAPRSYEGETLPFQVCPSADVRCDPKDPIHAQVWAHHLDADSLSSDDVNIVNLSRALPRVLANPVRAGLKKAPELAFRAGDTFLEDGGQVALDVAAFVPGLNIATEGLQGLYHYGHAKYDSAHGRTAAAAHQTAEAEWHAASAALNASTGDFGPLANAAHEASGAEKTVETIHNIVDAHEASWDLASSVVGDEEKLPFFGGIVPWAMRDGHRGGERE